MSSDSSVIERSLRTPAAFGELIHRHAPVVHRYAARRVGDVVADDVTSETFLVAFDDATDSSLLNRMHGRGCWASPPTSRIAAGC